MRWADETILPDKRVATYQNGSPTTIIGPPTYGTRVLSEFWRDALGGECRCTQAGTPGMWLQIRPAAVTADPSTGTIPVGYWVWDITSGLLKRHAGGHVWETPAALGGRTHGNGWNFGDDASVHGLPGTTASASDTACFPVLRPVAIGQPAA